MANDIKSDGAYETLGYLMSNSGVIKKKATAALAEVENIKDEYKAEYLAKALKAIVEDVGMGEAYANKMLASHLNP